MTNEELEALPIIGDYGMRTEIRDGRKVNIPVLPPVAERSALWMGPDEQLLIFDDKFGASWEVLNYEGRQVRRRWR